MKKLLFLLLFSSPSFGQERGSLFGENSITKREYKLVDVDQLYVEHRKYEALRDPYFEEGKDDWENTTNFNWNVSILGAFYWENRIHMEMDQSQVRGAGWEYTVGVSVFPILDVVKYHHSRHILEDKREGGRKFPVEDSIGVRIYFKK